MANFKCKMCGGNLEIDEAQTIATCKYCHTTQTLPKLNDDRRANLYDRANHFRRNIEFDKAISIYEQILNEDSTDAEAYWSLVLCRFGIEYVEDPASHKRIPTVHRAQFTSVFNDENYKLAIKNADPGQRKIYEEDAKTINDIQRDILAISAKEKPFDIFICYKETDSDGKRTHDSVLAQDLYYELSEQGFKVFFSRITLEDKLGSAYEPYIFAALNSSKVMVVLGTKAEHFNAVWVKNEWSRYLSLIKNGAKKTLIPAYRDMDPYDLPEEFSHLQAQDMSKLGFMQDLVRGINKIIKAQDPKSDYESDEEDFGDERLHGDAQLKPLIKRMMMFLEDGEWEKADEYCEKILDIEPECSKAYIGKLMSKAHVKTIQDLHKADFASPEISKLYDKACRFANSDEYDLYKSQYALYEERRAGERQKYEEDSLFDKFYIGTVQVSEAVINKINSMLQSKQILAAIKYVRETANLGLADAKAWIENFKNHDLNNPQPHFESTSSNKSTQSPPYSDPDLSLAAKAEIERLEKRYKTQIIWGLIGLLYWPVAVVMFICAHSTNKKIQALKKGMRNK